MKKALLVIAAAVLVGCGTASSVRVNVPTSDRVTFQFSDERPTEDRKSRLEKSRSGVTSFYGDETLLPAAPDLFKSYLAANLNGVLSGKTVKLSVFSVSASDPRVSIDGERLDNASRSVQNANPLSMMLAVPLILGIESIKSHKLVSVRILSLVDEQEFSSQCSDSFQGRATENNIQTVVLTCLEQIGHDIRTTYSR